MDAHYLFDRMKTAADISSGIAMAYFGHVRASLKPDKTHVTAADTEIEAALRDYLPRVIEGSVVVGEENAGDAMTVAAAEAAEWVWVVDPIDGTAIFVDALPMFCVCIGLAHRGRPYAGVVRFPATGDDYSAVKGAGAYFNGNKMTAVDEHGGDHAVLPLYVDSKVHREYEVKFPGKLRSIGSTAAHIVLTARGASAGAFGDGKVWDFLAAAAILEEAGGECKYLDGSEVDWKSVLTSRNKLPKPLLATLSGHFSKLQGMIRG